MAATKAPYGDVSYADPGYQADKQKRYPLDSAEHVRAAWSYINMPKNAAQYSAAQVASIKGRIRAAGAKYGIKFEGDEGTASRSQPEFFHRSFPLMDLQIQRGGDGRTVEAYAAVFHQEAEIRDGQGHYLEVIDPTAFDRALDHKRPTANRSNWAVGVFYNHARDLYGNPSAEFSKPIGVPMDIRADGKGLVTVTRYSETPLADEVLQLVRDGAISGQSFTGQIMRSNPMGRKYTPSFKTGQLTRVTRLELGLTEYGPTPSPAYEGAGILSVRSLLATPPGDPAQGDILTPAGDVTDDPRKHSARFEQLKTRTQGVLNNESSNRNT